MVAQAVTIRFCRDGDLDHFGRFGSAQHVEYCREEFARGADTLAILVAVPVPNPASWMRKELTC